MLRLLSVSFLVYTLTPRMLACCCAVLANFDYVFAENGLVAYKAGQLVATASLKSFLGEVRAAVLSMLTCAFVRVSALLQMCALAASMAL